MDSRIPGTSTGIGLLRALGYVWLLALGVLTPRSRFHRRESRWAPLKEDQHVTFESPNPKSSGAKGRCWQLECWGETAFRLTPHCVLWDCKGHEAGMSRSEVQQRRGAAPAHFPGALLEVTPIHRFPCSAWGWLCLAGVRSKCSLLLGWGPHWLLGLEFGRGSCPLCTEVSLWGRVPGRPGQADEGRAWGHWHRLCRRWSEWCFLGLLWTSYSCALTCFLQTPVS